MQLDFGFVVELNRSRGAKWRKLALPLFMTAMISFASVQSDPAGWNLGLVVVVGGTIIWLYWAALQPDRLTLGPWSLAITREGATKEFRWVDIETIVRVGGRVMMFVVGDRERSFRKRRLVTLSHSYGTESAEALTKMLRERWEAAIPDTGDYIRRDEAKDRQILWIRVAVWGGIVVFAILATLIS